jgi:hypothetical protein
LVQKGGEKYLERQTACLRNRQRLLSIMENNWVAETDVTVVSSTPIEGVRAAL